ncbi:MAG: type II toxin-antitoxin system HicB family antitoxin [Chloroflexi bacterium]|nr:type II toxin-antitoxin system HicB family antitoxin [Chloroflexota bacterium]MYE32575.1 type II toxin-antitoxin system HicB family antitoxin [Chloroflexota bacterium]
MTDEAILAEADLIAARPYTFTLVLNEGGVWTSGVLEIPGVVSEGDDPAEAIEMARDALREMAIVRIEDGLEIPEPFNSRDYSGKLQLRIPPGLHRRAAMLAAQEGVSLNRWLSAAVAASSNEPAASEPARLQA